MRYNLTDLSYIGNFSSLPSAYHGITAVTRAPADFGA